MSADFLPEHSRPDQERPDPKKKFIDRAHAFLRGEEYLSPLCPEAPTAVSLNDFVQDVGAVINQPRGEMWPYIGESERSTLIFVGGEANPRQDDLASVSLVEFPDAEDAILSDGLTVVLGIGLTARQEGEMTGRAWQVTRDHTGEMQMAALDYVDGAPTFSHWAEADEVVAVHQMIIDSAEIAAVDEKAARMQDVFDFMHNFPLREEGDPRGLERDQSTGQVYDIYLLGRTYAQGTGGRPEYSEDATSYDRPYRYKRAWELNQRVLTSDTGEDPEWQADALEVVVYDYTHLWPEVDFNDPSGNLPVALEVIITADEGGLIDEQKWSVVVDEHRMGVVLVDQDNPRQINRWCSDEEIAGLQKVLRRVNGPAH